MKKHLRIVFFAPFMGAGVVMLALCAFTPVTRADIIINNIGDPINAHETQSGNPLGQVFTMSGTSGNISALTLGLYSTVGGSAAVGLYNATSGGTPTTLVTSLGNVTVGNSGSQSLTVSLANNPLLTAGDTYAVVITPSSSSVAWDATTTSGSGPSATGTLGGIYYYDSGSSTWFSQDTGHYGLMNLQAVPEVPITGAVMGFGALVVALGHGLRRKLRLAMPDIS